MTSQHHDITSILIAIQCDSLCTNCQFLKTGIVDHIGVRSRRNSENPKWQVRVNFPFKIFPKFVKIKKQVTFISNVAQKQILVRSDDNRNFCIACVALPNRVRAYGLVTAVVCVGTMWLCFIKLSDLECCNQKLINIYNQHCIYNFQTEIIGLSTSNHFAKQTVALKLCWKLHPLFTDYTMIKDVILKVLIRVTLTFQWHKRTFPVHITC